MPGKSTGEAAASGDVCVLWHARGQSPDPELSTVLGRRKIQLVNVSSAPIALAKTCRLHQQHFGPDANPSGSGLVILLLDNPASLESGAAVINVVYRYAPRTVCWVFDRVARSLKSVSPDECFAWGTSSPGGSEGAAGRRSSPPRLRLTGEGAVEPDASGGGVRGIPPGLTDEELQMLLAPDRGQGEMRQP